MKKERRMIRREKNHELPSNLKIRLVRQRELLYAYAYSKKRKKKNASESDNIMLPMHKSTATSLDKILIFLLL